MIVYFCKYVGPYKGTSVPIPNLPSFSECTLASNLELADNVPFILSTALNEPNSAVNKFSLEFNNKYKSSKVSVVGIEWKINGQIKPNESANLTLKMKEGKEYEIVCSVYSTDHKSVYKKDIEFCASKKLGQSKLNLSECKPVNIKETTCRDKKNETSEKVDSELLRPISIIIPFSKNITI